ncbi:MAG TPA: helix-turn-helix domain-containing protein [Kiloniellaceae bacterium]|nr:helix-turn-helix domain-containing protein [Kiloniellaceae bacterium]HIP80101.1 helix-turn-helix domain-containing protein [Kiloniellaceae bacterium]
MSTDTKAATPALFPKESAQGAATTPPTVALVALPDTSASTLYGMYDIFCSAGRDWDFLTTGKAGASALRPLVVAETSAPFPAANGVILTPDLTFADCAPPQIVCIPDVFVAPGALVPGRYDAVIGWLRRCYAAGSTLAAACSGSLLLAETGLLDGQDATTHWGYCEALGQSYPAVTVHPARALVASGDGQRLITSGGGTSWQDLALYLVARFLGQDEAMRLGRVYLADWHSHGQLPYSALARVRQVEDNRIAASQEWIADHYAEAGPVAAMAARSGLPERSFKRRFAKATGMTPLDYVHTLRLEEAKQILETTDLAIEAVAQEIGYEDASFFRRLFRRKVGMSPADYRRRFGGFRKALTAAAI